MRRLTYLPLGVVALILVLSGCAREDPRMARKDAIDAESERSVATAEELRQRMRGQAQR